MIEVVINKFKHYSVDYLSSITIAHLSSPLRPLSPNNEYSISIAESNDTASLNEHLGSLRGIYLSRQNPGKIDEDLHNFLLRSPSASFIRSLTIEDSRISAHDILINSGLQKLEHLSVEGFKCPIGTEPTFSVHSNLESLSISSSANPTGRHIDLILAGVATMKNFAWKIDVSSILNPEEFRKSLDAGKISVAIRPLRCTPEDLSIEMLGIEGGGNFGDVEGFENFRYFEGERRGSFQVVQRDR
jgi:hypothetical protein